MTERKRLIIGNWKMYLSFDDSLKVAEHIAEHISKSTSDIVLCPSFPVLPLIAERVQGSSVVLGVQDIHEEEHGAYTGETSVALVRHIARYVIVGHSERRTVYGETYDRIAKKTSRALKSGIHPIVCVGETAKERDGGNAIEVVRNNVRSVLQGLPALDIPRVVFAYEPVWAIAPSRDKKAPQPSPHEVAEMVGLIRKIAAQVSSPQYAEKMRVVYGGSVTAKTVGSFVSEPGVDGMLVGGSSTKPGEFLTIIKEIETCR